MAAGWLAPGPAAGVSGGTPAPATSYAFAAHLLIGDTARACSGALVDPEWVLTATTCISADPVQAGRPPAPISVTVGKVDLNAATGGHKIAASEVVPHPTRNVTLVKLAIPVPDVTPVPLATTAPAAGETLHVAGFGRTADTWVPGRLHATTLSVESVEAATVRLAGSAEAPASICQGDAGGPALRPDGAGFQLVGLHHASGQAGCLGAPVDGATNAAIESRVDDLAGWVRPIVRGGNFVRLATGAQVLDTRHAIGAPTGPRAAGSVTPFQVTGVGGVPAASQVSAVAVDIVAVTGASATHLSVYPDGTTRSAANNVNAAPNQTISNFAVIPVTSTGKLNVFTNGGGVHIIIDVQGYFTKAPGTTGGGFVPTPYARTHDTRSGLGGVSGTIAPGSFKTFKLTGGPVPAGATAVLMDLIATGATAQGWIGHRVPGGTHRSIMDYVEGTTSHPVTVKLETNGTAIFTNNSGSAIHLVMTPWGYFTGSATTGAGLRVRPLQTRLLDTRSVGTGAPVAANRFVDIDTRLPVGATALVKLTVVNNSAIGYFRVFPTGGTEPTASVLNYPHPPNPHARSSVAAARVGTDGKIRVINDSEGTTHIVADLQSWFY